MTTIPIKRPVALAKTSELRFSQAKSDRVAVTRAVEKVSNALRKMWERVPREEPLQMGRMIGDEVKARTRYASAQTEN